MLQKVVEVLLLENVTEGCGSFAVEECCRRLWKFCFWRMSQKVVEVLLSCFISHRMCACYQIRTLFGNI
jgi:hypothetical protein